MWNRTYRIKQNMLSVTLQENSKHACAMCCFFINNQLLINGNISKSAWWCLIAPTSTGVLNQRWPEICWSPGWHLGVSSMVLEVAREARALYFGPVLRDNPADNGCTILPVTPTNGHRHWWSLRLQSLGGRWDCTPGRSPVHLGWWTNTQ